MTARRLFISLTALLLPLATMAQNTQWGGVSQLGGVAYVSTGTTTPPPPSGLPVSFFASSWNKTPPTVWPPTDSLSNQATITGARMWDDGVKWGQLETSSGVWGPAFTSTLTNFINTTIPAYPMDVLYTFGDTPTWAALGTDSACATPSSSSCVPPNDLDLSSTTCNATPNSTGAQDSIVLANCGNGADAQWQAAVYHIVSTFKGKIRYYECWNEPDGAGNFWSNSASFGGLGAAPTRKNQPPLVRLVRMCYDLVQIVHQTDPAARVLSPSFHGPTALTWMHYYATTSDQNPGCSGSCSSAIGGATWSAATITGAQTFDITNAHLRGSGSGSTSNANPTAFLTEYANAITEITNDSLPHTLFDDEWGCLNQSTPAQCQTQDVLAYYYAASLAIRASVYPSGYLQRVWQYQWDAPGGTGVTALQGNAAGTAWNVVSGWLTGSTTAACTNASTVWTCPITKSAVAQSIVWNTATITANTITGVAIVGGNAVYGCSTGCANLAGEYITVSGFSHSGNNGSFTVTSSTATSITTNNIGGTAESGASASYTYLPVTCGVNCPTQSTTFGHWTDLTGTTHVVSGGLIPLGAKPVLLTP